LNLVEDLFGLSKVGSNKLEVCHEKTDLLQLIKDIKNIFSSSCENTKIKLNLIVTDEINRYVESDPVRLKQILTNLVGNAVKFSKTGDEIKFIVSKREDQIVFDVIDQGLGIPEEKQDSIFTAFEQVDINHTRQFGGAGLGLSISKNLASLLKGNIELVESKINIGSHFRASFTLNSFGSMTFSQKNIEIQETPKTLAKVEHKFKNLNGKKILLAEDSKENQILFKIFLESEGLIVDTAESGLDAVKFAFNKSHDLILMDIQMPGLDGYEATKILKDAGYDKKIIALTAHSIAGEKEKCLKLGFDGYISKPVSKINLLLTISKFID
jgi:CheY-like chemotaxis protein/two-component sensor histidine kinase